MLQQSRFLANYNRQTNILFDIYNNAHYVIQKGLQYSAHDSD